MVTALAYLPCKYDTVHAHLSVSHIIARVPVPRSTLCQMLLNSSSWAGEGRKFGILILGFNSIIMPSDITCFLVKIRPVNYKSFCFGRLILDIGKGRKQFAPIV